MRHDVKACRASGKPCDGCRLVSGLSSVNRPAVTKVDAAPFRYVINAALAGGVSIADISERSGIAERSLLDILYGRRQYVMRSTAAKLREALLSYAPSTIGGATTDQPA